MKKYEIKNIGQKRLLDWMEGNNMSINALVNEAKLCYSFGHAFVSGKQRPGLEIAVRIEDITKGYVRCRDWLKLYSEPKPKHHIKKTTKHPNAKD